MNFRLSTLLYLVALVAASLTAFGAWGLLVAASVVACWSFLLHSTYPEHYLGELFVKILALVLLFFMMLPMVQAPRDVYRRAMCLNLMRQLATALIAFDAQEGHLPIVGEAVEVKVTHSWRVAISPELDRQDLHCKYDFNERWDGPNNSKLLPQINLNYSCISHAHGAGSATYFAVTGLRTAWGDGEVRKLADVSDGADRTILLIESGGLDVHWTEPRDLSFHEAIDLLTEPLPLDGGDGHRVDDGYFYKTRFVRHVAMCDGSTYALQIPLERETAVALLTANGGEQIEEELLEQFSGRRLDYARIWGFSLFVLIALLPAIPAIHHQIWPTLANHISTVSEQSDVAV